MANDAKFNFYLNRTGPRGQKGEKGDQGFSPSITVNTDTADEYTLLIQNEYDSFVTDNIRPTYDDRGGTYVRVDRANNVQYFGEADIATTANYGEVKLAQASDLASTVDVGNSNVITAELLKTWFDGQVADNLVTTTNNVTIQGQKIFATPTRFMDTVRIGNRLMVTQDDTGTITFDSSETGTVIGTHLTSTGDASFSKNVNVNGTATIGGDLNVAGNAVISSPQLGNTTVSGGLTTKADINIQGQKVHLQDTNPTMYLKNMNGVNEIEIFRGLFTAGNPSPADNYLDLGHSQLQLNLTGKAIKANGKDVATTDTVETIQTDLNIAKQDIIEAQGDIDNLQMNKQNKLTAGTGITIDADNVISTTGGGSADSYTKSETDALLSEKNDNIFDIGKFTVVGNPTITDDGIASGFGASNYIKIPYEWAKNVTNFKITGKFKVENSVQGTNSILGYVTDGYAMGLSFNSTSIQWFAIRTSSEDVTLVQIYSITPNIDYSYELQLNNNLYTFRLFDDTGSAVVNLSKSTNSPFSITDSYLRLGASGNYNPLNFMTGSIDLKQFSISVDGKEVFNGLMNSTKPIYDAIKANNTELSEFKTDTDNNFSAVNSALNEKANLSDLTLKQNLLVSGTNIKTINGETILGEGNITVCKPTDLESAVANKQDKLTAISPVNIATKVLSPTEGWVVSSSSMQSRYKEKVANEDNSLHGDKTSMYLTSDSEYPIKSYIAMPYTVGQVVKYRQNYQGTTQTTLVLGDIIDGKIYPVLISSPTGSGFPQYTTALFDGTQELTKDVMTNGIKYSSSDRPGPGGQAFINQATFGWLQNTGTSLVWHVFYAGSSDKGSYGYVTYTSFNGYTIDDLVEKIKYAIILAGNTSLAYTPDQFGVYENTLSSYSNISDYQALSPNLFDLSKNEVQTQISTLPATISSLGVVKPDGTTITITDDGTISAVGGGSTVEGTTLQQGAQFTLNLTGNGTLGGSTPACTGSTYENGHPYYYAFKGATSSTPTKELWGPSSSAGNQYLILDCVTPIALQSFRWTNGGVSAERFPTIVFKGSNDNSNYTTLGTYQTQNPTDDSVTIENDTPYRYYRFDFPTGASYGKLGFISMSGVNRYNILNIGDGLDVIDGQLTCTSSDAPILDVPVNNCILAMPTAPSFDGTNVTVYTGTKVAIPNGLNADGTCKSNIVTLTADATINQSTFNGDVTLMLKSDGTIDQTAYSYFEVDDISTITTLTAYCWYYDRKTNNHYLASSTGAKQGPYQRIKIGSYNQAEAATTKYFRTYRPIALEKLDITGSCMPDYTRPLTFTPNVVTTATFDCWLCGQFNVDQSKNSVIKFYNSAGTVIKGFDIASGSAYTNRRFHNIPLPKGTIYEVSLSTSSLDAYIYPCIGGMTNA